MGASGFAERLQLLRERAALSQYALARRAGLSKQALSRLEKGDREPSWDTVQRIAAALGVDCTAFADPNLEMPPVEPARPRGRPPRAAPGQRPKRPKGRSRKGG
jgi:transcriptional regulator with XRE-family HTH domain